VEWIVVQTVDWEEIMQKHGVKTLTEILWKRNRTSLTSPEIWKILRPRSLRKSNVKGLNGPRLLSSLLLLLIMARLYKTKWQKQVDITGNKLLEFLLCDKLLRFQHNEGSWQFTASFVGLANNCSILHSNVWQQQSLQLSRRHLVNGHRNTLVHYTSTSVSHNTVAPMKRHFQPVTFVVQLACVCHVELSQVTCASFARNFQMCHRL